MSIAEGSSPIYRTDVFTAVKCEFENRSFNGVIAYTKIANTLLSHWTATHHNVVTLDGNAS